MGEYTRTPFVDTIIKNELIKIRTRVLNKDRDFVACYDGEEGVGKSVLAQQHALILDPNFCLDNIVFTSDDFIKKIKDPNTVKGACIILDEAFNAASSRASLSEVNRAMVALATEMRQKNLFVLLVLPSFFDLDRYFALWRCRALFHVYFTPDEDRHYVAFDKDSKKLLYLSGKKTYNYTYPKAPFPPSNFYNQYVVDETEYRKKKAEAFKKRTVSFRAKQWLEQRNAFIRHLYTTYAVTYDGINQILLSQGVGALDVSAFSRVMTESQDLTQ
jgi:hypothetical protein